MGTMMPLGMIRVHNTEDNKFFNLLSHCYDDIRYFLNGAVRCVSGSSSTPLVPNYHSGALACTVEVEINYYKARSKGPVRIMQGSNTIGEIPVELFKPKKEDDSLAVIAFNLYLQLPPRSSYLELIDYRGHGFSSKVIPLEVKYHSILSNTYKLPKELRFYLKLKEILIIDGTTIEQDFDSLEQVLDSMYPHYKDVKSYPLVMVQNKRKNIRNRLATQQYSEISTRKIIIALIHKLCNFLDNYYTTLSSLNSNYGLSIAKKVTL